MGDAIDNVKGVPGIGEKGARELHRDRTARSTRCSSARPRCRRRSTARRCWPTPTTRAQQPRAAAHPHRRAGRVRPRRAPLSRADAERTATSCSRELGFRSLVHGVRADRRHDRDRLPAVTTAELVALVDRSASAGRWASRRSAGFADAISAIWPAVADWHAIGAIRRLGPVRPDTVGLCTCAVGQRQLRGILLADATSAAHVRGPP